MEDVTQRIDRQKAKRGGFTIAELLGVVAVIGVIVYLAFPAMRTFSGMTYATSAATRITHTFNRARSQSMRRNRAVLVDFILFRSDGPGGQIDFSEARTNSCVSLANQIQAGEGDVTEYLDSIPVGGTIVANYKGTNEKDVGLLGWRRGREGELATTRVKLCVSPNGRTFLVDRDARTLDSWIEVGVQRYKPSDDAASTAVGPPVRILFPGFGAARLATN